MVFRKVPEQSSGHGTDAGDLDKNDVVELYCWGAGWGLSSVDTESLQALAIARFAGAPTKLIECNNPWASPSGSLPFFKHGKNTFFSATELATHLRGKNFSCDYGLSGRECSDVISYGEYIAEALNPALQYFSWVNESNFSTVIRPFYGYRLPWLYKMWYPDRLKKKALALVSTIIPDAEFNPDLAEQALLERAGTCIRLLSDKLDTSEFFMNQSSPSTLDGIVYSYLAPFLKIPFSYNPIREYILATPNLERFVSRISQRYLAAPGGQGDMNSSSSSSTNDKPGPHGDSKSFFSPDRDSPYFRGFVAGIVGSLAMLLYAYRIGLVPGHHQHQEITYEDEEEDEGEY